MPVVRVPVIGTVNKAVRINSSATDGATLGLNLFDEDGELLTIEAIAARVTVVAEASAEVNEFVFESQVLDGALLARLADDETVPGDWTFTGVTTVPEATVTDHEAAINHDALTNFVADEHIDWTVDAGVDVHAANISEVSVTQHEAAIDHDALTNFVADEHIDWTADAGVDIHVANVSQAAVTQHEAAIDHDALTNFVAAEHIDWSVTGAEDIHVDRVTQAAVTQHEAAIDHDALTNFVANEHIDWTADAGVDVHADNISEASVTQHEAALTITESQISDLQSYLTSVQDGDIDSEAATDGYVLTADGAGNAAWEASAGGGVTDHGALTGLGDNDHPQYARLAINETVTGSWFFDGTTTAGAIQIRPNTTSDKWGLRLESSNATSNDSGFYSRSSSWGILLRDSAGNIDIDLRTDGADSSIADGLTVSGDFSAASYSGIDEADLLDKSANETITGSWDFSAGLDVIASAGGTGVTLRSEDSWTSGNLFLPFLRWQEADGTDHAGIRAYTTDGSTSVLSLGTGFFSERFRISNNGLYEFLAGSEVRVRGGASFKVYDPTDTDYIQLSEGGSNASLSTNNNNLQVSLAGGSGILDLVSGTKLRIRDSSNADNVLFGHDGTDFNATFNNTTWARFTGLDNGVLFLDGAAVRIYDSSNTDFVALNHTGTDFNSAFTNTVDWDVAGLTGEVDFNGAPVVVRKGINGSYSRDAGTGTDWAAPIWSIGDSWDGSGNSGSSWASTTHYGISWLRGSHADTSSLAGEGLYVYVSGTQQAALGQGGIVSFNRICNAGGTAGSPSYTFSADTDTGMFLLSGNNLAFSAGGSEGLRVRSIDVLAAKPVKILERAAAEIDNAGYGQIWVRNDTPNVLMFTDDAGTDFQVSGNTGSGVTSLQFLAMIEFVTLVNQSTALQFFSNSSTYRTKMDLSSYTQVRLVSRVNTAGASGSYHELRYHTSDSVSPISYSTLGSSAVRNVHTSTGIIDTGWINLVGGAIADNRYLALVMDDGNSSADPVISGIFAYFR